MRKKFKILSLVLVLALMVTACGAKEGEKPVEEGKLEEAREDLVINLPGGDWGYPNPFAHYPRGPGAARMRLIFDSLLEKDGEGYIPYLAESYNVSDDGLEYTFKLRDGLKWTDGKDLSYEDVKFSMEYLGEHPAVFDQLQNKDKDYIKDIEILDDAIKITVKEADATTLSSLGTSRIIPKHIWENVEDPTKFMDEASVIGSGPFKLAEYNQEQGAYKFVRNDDHWAKVNPKELNCVPVSDDLLAFENGEIDLSYITPDLLSKYEGNKDYKIVKSPAFYGYKLLLNMEKRPELLEKDLRQAMYYGLNREEMVEKVNRGSGIVANPAFLSPDNKFYNDKVKKYDFDLEKAKELMDGKKYKFSLITADGQDEIKLAELMKMSLAEIGIELEVKTVDSKTRDSMIDKGDYEIILNSHGGWGGDPELLKNQYANTGDNKNVKGYINEEINKLSEEQAKKTNEEERKEVIHKLQEVIAEELPVLPLYNTIELSVYRPAKYDGWTHIFDHHTMTHNKLSYVDVK